MFTKNITYTTVTNKVIANFVDEMTEPVDTIHTGENFYIFYYYYNLYSQLLYIIYLFFYK